MKDHHPQAEAGEDAGAAGAGAADPAADAQASAATTAPALPTAEQWATAQATLAGLQADKDATTAAAAEAAEAAEASRLETLSAAERLAEEQTALKADIAAQQAELRGDRRDIALDKLRVLPHFRGYVPDVDPRTAEGAAALEAWAKGHPEALRQDAAPQPDYVPRAQSALADIATGKKHNPLVPLASLRKIMGG